jgi:hypothetical protein
MSRVEPQEITWLWPGWFPLGMVSLVEGDPGQGKSTFFLDLAARVTTDGIMPDGTQGVSGAVAFMSAEDHMAATILPRLSRAEANISQVFSFSETTAGQPIVIPTDLDIIESRLRQFDCRLLVIDPLIAYLAEARSDQEVRRCLHPLKEVAERCRCSIIFLRHLNKSTGIKALYRGSGFISFTGAARSAVMIGSHPEDPSLKIMAASKPPNLGPTPQSQTFRLVPNEQGICRLAWGDPCDLTADDLCQDRRSDNTESASALHQASAFLNESCAEGPQPIQRLKQEAKLLGISERSLQRAARDLHLSLLKPWDLGLPRKASNYFWAIPGTLPVVPDDHQEGGST